MFYIFCSFTLLVCGEKNILPNLTNSHEPEPGVFGSLEPEPLEEKNKEPEPLEKKSQESEPLKSFPAPQPWLKPYLYINAKLHPLMVRIEEKICKKNKTKRRFRVASPEILVQLISELACWRRLYQWRPRETSSAPQSSTTRSMQSAARKLQVCWGKRKKRGGGW